MKNAQHQYQRQAIKNASPTELIKQLYDFAIQACHKQDEERLQQVLSALIKSLNFDYDIADELYNLYEYCQRQARQGEFEEVRELLEPVREAWIEGVMAQKEAPKTVGGKGFVV